MGIISGVGGGLHCSLTLLFSARCYAERGYAIVYCLSVRNVEVCFSHRLEYFENNFTV